MTFFGIVYLDLNTVQKHNSHHNVFFLSLQINLDKFDKTWQRWQQHNKWWQHMSGKTHTRTLKTSI